MSICAKMSIKKFMGFQGNFTNSLMIKLDAQLMSKKDDPKYAPKFTADTSSITEMWLPVQKSRSISIFVIEISVE